MSKFIKISEGILLGLLVLLLFLVAFETKLHIPNWLMVVGRMHPLFLHFPIVLLFIAFITVWLPQKDGTEELFLIIRLAAALSAVVTAIMGLLLSLESTNNGSTVTLHKWFGVSAAIAGFIFYHFYSRLSNAKINGRIYTIASALIIIITGHLGADISHGENYLLGPIENNEIKRAPLERAMIFDDVIKPIFAAKCATCHGDGAVKGGLILLDSSNILKGGKTGPLFISGDPAMSLLIKRIHLPVDDKKHMPPISKSQLSEEDIALLTAWIRSGARFNYKVTELPVTDSFRVLAAAYLQASVTNVPVYTFAAADEKKIKDLNNNYRVLEPQGIGSPALSVYFYGRNNYSKRSLEELLSVKEQIISLSLSRMPVTDDEMSVICQFSNLEKLNLNYTGITAKGIAQLTGLKKLQEISLSGTAVTAEAVEQILSLPVMSSVFIWNTKIDTLKVIALRKKFNKASIETGFIDDGKFVAELSPPIIESTGGVFDTMKIIKIKHPFKATVLRYTLDGTPPDSLKSPVYKDSFAIQTSGKLAVRAFSKGWKGSLPVQQMFIKRSFVPDSIELVTPPDPKYKAAAKILSDKDLGNTDFGSGKWLGYMNNPAVINLYFSKKTKLSSVMVNVLKRTEQYLFLPTTLEVWGGMDKSDLKLLGQIIPPLPTKNEPAVLVQQTISFAPTSVKCIKIIAKPIQSLPQWHAGKGKKGWVFVSEVVFN